MLVKKQLENPTTNQILAKLKKLSPSADAKIC
jgi:hypothetical protein